MRLAMAACASVAELAKQLAANLSDPDVARELHGKMAHSFGHLPASTNIGASLEAVLLRHLFGRNFNPKQPRKPT